MENSVYRLEQNIVMPHEAGYEATCGSCIYFYLFIFKFGYRDLKLHNVQMHYIATNCV